MLGMQKSDISEISSTTSKLRNTLQHNKQHRRKELLSSSSSI